MRSHVPRSIPCWISICLFTSECILGQSHPALAGHKTPRLQASGRFEKWARSPKGDWNLLVERNISSSSRSASGRLLHSFRVSQDTLYFIEGVSSAKHLKQGDHIEVEATPRNRRLENATLKRVFVFVDETLRRQRQFRRIYVNYAPQLWEFNRRTADGPRVRVRGRVISFKPLTIHAKGRRFQVAFATPLKSTDTPFALIGCRAEGVSDDSQVKVVYHQYYESIRPDRVVRRQRVGGLIYIEYIPGKSRSWSIANVVSFKLTRRLSIEDLTELRGTVSSKR